MTEPEKAQLHAYPQKPGRYLARHKDDVRSKVYTLLITVNGSAPWLRIVSICAISPHSARSGDKPSVPSDFFWGPAIELPTPEFEIVH